MKIFFVVVFNLIVANFIFAQKNNTNAVLETQAKRFAATIAQDSLALEKLLDKDLHYIHSNALVENKSKHIDAILKQRIVYQSFIYENEPSVFIEKNIAIVNGLVNVKGLYTQSPFDTHLYFMAVYKKEKKNWRLLKWQSTKKS
jgi:hypothetical protein